MKHWKVLRERYFFLAIPSFQKKPETGGFTEIISTHYTY